MSFRLEPEASSVRAVAAFELLCRIPLGASGAGGLGGFSALGQANPTWHHRIHHGGWTLTMAADRTLCLYRPDGTLDRIIDPPTPITRHGP